MIIADFFSKLCSFLPVFAQFNVMFKILSIRKSEK